MRRAPLAAVLAIVLASTAGAQVFKPRGTPPTNNGAVGSGSGSGSGSATPAKKAVPAKSATTTKKAAPKPAADDDADDDPKPAKKAARAPVASKHTATKTAPRSAKDKKKIEASADRDLDYVRITDDGSDD